MSDDGDGAARAFPGTTAFSHQSVSTTFGNSSANVDSLPIDDAGTFAGVVADSISFVKLEPNADEAHVDHQSTPQQTAVATAAANPEDDGAAYAFSGVATARTNATFNSSDVESSTCLIPDDDDAGIDNETSNVDERNSGVIPAGVTMPGEACAEGDGESSAPVADMPPLDSPNDEAGHGSEAPSDLQNDPSASAQPVPPFRQPDCAVQMGVSFVNHLRGLVEHGISDSKVELQSKVNEMLSAIHHHAGSCSVEHLHFDEILAIVAYTAEATNFGLPNTANIYIIVNEFLRLGREPPAWFSRKMLPSLQCFTSVLLTAVGRLPKLNVYEVYRVVSHGTHELLRLVQGQRHTLQGITSVTTSWEFAAASVSRRSKATPCVALTIRNVDAVDISGFSMFKREKELVLLPGTVIRVTFLAIDEADPSLQRAHCSVMKGGDVISAPTGAETCDPSHGACQPMPLYVPRTALEDRALALLSDPLQRMVVLCGPSGTGKSYLAAGLLHRLGAKHRDVLRIECSGGWSAMQTRLRIVFVEATDSGTWSSIAGSDARPVDVLSATVTVTQSVYTLLENLDDSAIIEDLVQRPLPGATIVTSHSSPNTPSIVVNVELVGDQPTAVAIGRKFFRSWTDDGYISSDEDVLCVARDVCNWRPYVIARVLSGYGRYVRDWQARPSEPKNAAPLQLKPWLDTHSLRSVDATAANDTMYRGRTFALVNRIRRERLAEGSTLRRQHDALLAALRIMRSTVVSVSLVQHVTSQTNDSADVVPPVKQPSDIIDWLRPLGFDPVPCPDAPLAAMLHELDIETDVALPDLVGADLMCRCLMREQEANELPIPLWFGRAQHTVDAILRVSRIAKPCITPLAALTALTETIFATAAAHQWPELVREWTQRQQEAIELLSIPSKRDAFQLLGRWADALSLCEMGRDVDLSVVICRARCLSHLGDTMSSLTVLAGCEDVVVNQAANPTYGPPTHSDTASCPREISREPEPFDVLRDEVLPLFLATLGPDNLSVLATKHGIAAYLDMRGHTSEALDILQSKVLPRQLAMLDTNRFPSARPHENEGELASGALKVVQSEVLPRFLETLGPESHAVIALKYGLATYLHGVGRTSEAMLMLQDEVLPQQLTTLGEEHPSVLTTRQSIAFYLDSLGRTAEALEMLQTEVLPKRQSALGTEHPTVLTTKSNLASYLNKLGRTPEAIAILKTEVLPPLLTKLGEYHPLVLTTKDCITSFQNAVDHT